MNKKWLVRLTGNDIGYWEVVVEAHEIHQAIGIAIERISQITIEVFIRVEASLCVGQ
jgi:hypothetical protein